MSSVALPDRSSLATARAELDAWVRELMEWHFNPDTGCQFWIDWAARAGGIRATRSSRTTTSTSSASFQDEWLRGGPVRRWVPRAYQDRAITTFETGGSTGVPKSRINIDDFRIDYEMFSRTLPDESFPKGADWLQVGPSGPRRLRLAIEHLAQHRGGICFGVDLDPRWVIKLIKWGDMETVETYKRHVIDQALTLLKAHETIQLPLHHAEAARSAVRADLAEEGRHHRRVLRRHGDDAAVSSLCGRGVDGRRLLRPDLRQHADGAGHAQASRARRQLGGDLLPADAARDDRSRRSRQPPHEIVEYGNTGRVRLTTLTREFFMPRFLERDEAEREPPCARYPWDGVRNVRPFPRFGTAVVEGVY